MKPPALEHIGEGLRPGVPVEYFGQGRDPDWRVERRPDGTYWWCVVDWQGETVAHGVTGYLGEAVTAAVKWSGP